MKSIAIISHNYPSKSMPQNGAFVYNLVQELNSTQNIIVIAPFKITDIFKKKHDSYGSERCKVIRPLYLSLGNRKIFGINLHKLTNWFHNNARKRALGSLKHKPNLIYCHFLDAGIGITKYVKKYKIPMIIASGESSYSHINNFYSKKELQEFFNVTNFMICVSKTNQKELHEMGYPKNKTRIVPNAVDFKLFKPKNKISSKNKIGIHHSKFVVGFIGHFINRKGPNRVVDSISLLNDDGIRFVCVGSGGDITKNNFTQIISPVSNNLLPDIINAFDVFVLPTLSEGHCNVIEEAKACCIPVISSLHTTVETQIKHGFNGFLVDPTNIYEIKKHIKKLKNNNKLRDKMVKNLQSQRGGYSIKSRASIINEIINNHIK